MNTKIIAFFPDSPHGRAQAQGHILRVEGKVIEEDFEAADSRDTDDYQLETDDFPRLQGIYTLEAMAAETSEWDQPKYIGTWRKATAEDLKGLIE